MGTFVAYATNDSDLSLVINDQNNMHMWSYAKQFLWIYTSWFGIQVNIRGQISYSLSVPISSSPLCELWSAQCYTHTVNFILYKSCFPHAGCNRERLHGCFALQEQHITTHWRLLFIIKTTSKPILTRISYSLSVPTSSSPLCEL